MTQLRVRSARASDEPGIRALVLAAFGGEEGGEIADLVAALRADPSARPCLELVATQGDARVGHVLFSKARLEPPDGTPSCAILAPLSVLPERQNQGIGGRLVREGLERLRAARVGLVFVLGHPAYYPRHGFSPAGEAGFEAPHAIAPENAEAWMVRPLRPGLLGQVAGGVVCADALDDPRHWRE